MKVMVVGGGGREHTIIKKIKENKNVSEIFKTHVAYAFIEPCVAKAHFTVEVASCGGFYIEFSQHGNPP